MQTIIEEKDLRNKNYVFADREDAGELLARKLKPYLESLLAPIVLAIPSGGVPVGKVISKELGIPMDLIIVRKIPIPQDTEAGFGSVSWDGEIELNEKLVYQLQLSGDEIESAILEVKKGLKQRIEKFRGSKPFPELRGRSVIIVDDGLASGYTMLSAIRSIKKYSPARIIIAVPTASMNAIELVRPHANEIFCLNIRNTMHFAVADAYEKWYDLDEQEVLQLLKS